MSWLHVALLRQLDVTDGSISSLARMGVDSPAASCCLKKFDLSLCFPGPGNLQNVVTISGES